MYKTLKEAAGPGNIARIAHGDGAIYPDGSEIGQPTYNAISLYDNVCEHGIRAVYAAAAWGKHPLPGNGNCNYLIVTDATIIGYERF